ncbi:hypothetical protein BU25DRAFT_460122 [Macroventuria anomochaeta]|uniref:Uncharacterized protein n=1 Tax=Macroventuria anomochaeta TaxID=301207 RepID=A0ACB6RXB2_9PLEO|nr:uncharacterized protein BU25DRAFT_460122 [Macroventuria anomochaeta]KAF2625778.1 hypothetical protein BU25DRAFT_460122 [Macroventuria anomochaeta]
MSSPYCDNDVTLPHAGLLSYFRQPHETHDCDKSAQSARSTSPSLNDIKYRVFDEEAQCDFWDLDSTTDTDCEILSQPARHRYNGIFHTLYDFWSFVCVVTLAACAVLLGLDLALGQFGMGLALTDCIMGRHLPPPPMAHELHFCLASSNREAPGPQTWRLMSMRPHDDCTTEVITLLVSPSEGWKLHSDDEIVFCDERRGSIQVSKFLGNGNVLPRGNLGDNVAGEGVLSQSGKETFEGGLVIV